MTMHQNPRHLAGVTGRSRRGLVAARAEMPTDVKAALESLNRAFEAFKAENDAKITDVRKGFDDVVRAEKVERINAAVTEMQATVDDLARKVAANALGGGAGTAEEPEMKAYREAFYGRGGFLRRGVDAGLRDLAIKAKLATDTDPDGGYVTPTQTDTAIQRVQRDLSAMRSLATVMTISAPVYKKLVSFGGATANWVGERDARPETETPKLGALEFPVMELEAMPAATQTMLDDAAIDVEAWLAQEVGYAFDEKEADAFIGGDGVSRPKGLLAYPAVANASWSWGKLGYVASGAAADFAATNPADALIDLIYGLRRAYRQNARFLMNDLTVSKVRKFKDGQGNYLWQPSAQAGQPATLLNYAIESDDYMPDVGANAFPIAFGDFRRGYLIVDRIGVRVLRDPYSAKPYVLFYTTKRVGGGIADFEALKLFKIATS